jgi:hypothetical protein
MATTTKHNDLPTQVLLVHPETPQQRALRVVRTARLDHQANAVNIARQKYATEPLAWLLPDGTFVPVAP